MLILKLLFVPEWTTVSHRIEEAKKNIEWQEIISLNFMFPQILSRVDKPRSDNWDLSRCEFVLIGIHDSKPPTVQVNSEWAENQKLNLFCLFNISISVVALYLKNRQFHKSVVQLKESLIFKYGLFILHSAGDYIVFSCTIPQSVLPSSEVFWRCVMNIKLT